MKWWNGETVILTFSSPLFYNLTYQWGPSTLLDYIRCFIQLKCIIRLWAVPRWLYNLPPSLSHTLLCRTPKIILIDTFRLSLPFSTSNTGGVRPLYKPPYYWNCSLLMYCKYIILSLWCCNICITLTICQ